MRQPPLPVATQSLPPLDALFTPRTVAVLGASRHPEKLGHRLLRNLLDYGFAGAVYPVNPSGEAILGLAAVPEVGALPDGLDLALVSLPAGAVVDAVRALGAKGCRVAVVLASGFGESDTSGSAREAELRTIARRSGMRLVGPNCMGVVSPAARLNGSYFWEVPARPGPLSFVSQSGAYGGLFFREVRERGLGVAKFLSIGNQADLALEEVLAWLGEDPETGAIALFVEAIGDGRAFVEAARRVTAKKPVIALKAGRTEAGRRAAGSHTGALAGVYETYLAAFEAAGIVTARETEGLFDGLVALAAQGDRPPEDEALAILTISGGPAVVAADAAEASGLRVPELPDRVRRALRQDLPAFGADRNPVDMTPQIAPARFARAIRTVLESSEVSGALAVNVGLDRPEFAEAVLAASAATGKPVVACLADVPDVAAALVEGGVPCLPTPERAVGAYRALVTHARLRRRPAPILPRPRAPALALEGEGPLGPEAARALLEAYGVPVPREGAAASAEEAMRVAAEVGFPVVVKTALPGLLHKSEAGGVVLDVRTQEELREACRTLAARFGDARVLIQEQVGPGLELIVGGRQDPRFGPVILVGLGGTLAEALREVAVRLAPLAPGDAQAMLEEGRVGALLQGGRGRPPADRKALAAVVEAVGQLLWEHPEVRELDLNPLIVRGERVVAVDALLIVGRPEPENDGRREGP